MPGYSSESDTRHPVTYLPCPARLAGPTYSTVKLGKGGSALCEELICRTSR
jgi:hypothetical protein